MRFARPIRVVSNILWWERARFFSDSSVAAFPGKVEYRRLCAGRGRAGRDPAGVSDGLRGGGGQHQRQHHAVRGDVSSTRRGFLGEMDDFRKPRRRRYDLAWYLTIMIAARLTGDTPTDPPDGKLRKRRRVQARKQSVLFALQPRLGCSESDQARLAASLSALASSIAACPCRFKPSVMIRLILFLPCSVASKPGPA